MFTPIRSLYALRPRAPLAVLTAVSSTTLMFVATPFLVPTISSGFAVSEGSAGGISVAQVGAFAAANLLLPRLVKPSGRLFTGNAMAFLLFNLLSLIPNSFPTLIILRAAAGWSAGTLTWLAWGDAMTKPRSMASVSMIGPLTAGIGAPLLALAADGGYRPVYAILAVGALLPIFLSFEPQVSRHQTRGRSRSRSNRVLLASLFMLTFSGASLFVYLAVIARDVIGLSPTTTSLAYSLNAGAAIFGARLSSRHRRPGWWLFSIAPAALLAGIGTEAWMFFAAMTWWGFAFWMGLPGVMEMLAQRSLEPSERAGDAQGLMAVGRSLGPLLGGGLADISAYTTMAIITAGGTMATGLTVIAVQEGRDRLPPAPPEKHS